MIIQSLLIHPNEIFETKEDGEAQLWLLELGLAGKFSNLPSSRTQMITHGEHPTHFIVAMFFTGKTKASDNGYLVYCLPKSKFPPHQAMAFVQKLASLHDYVESAKEIDPHSSEN